MKSLKFHPLNCERIVPSTSSWRTPSLSNSLSGLAHHLVRCGAEYINVLVSLLATHCLHSSTRYVSNREISCGHQRFFGEGRIFMNGTNVGIVDGKMFDTFPFSAL